MRPDEFSSLVPGSLGNFEHALFIGGVTGSLTAHVANSINGDLTVCDFDAARLSDLKQLQGLSKPISLRHVLPVPAGSADIKTGHLCSETMHSSLALPAMIREKMPGLTFSETQVSTSSVDELVSEMGLNDVLSNLLVISVTGFEELWLDAEVELLRYFDVVLVRLPVTGLFDTTVQGDQLLSNLALPGIALPFGNLPYRWWMIRRPVGWGAQQRAAEEASNQFVEKVDELDQALEIATELEAKLSNQAEMTDALKESLASKDHDLEQAMAHATELEAKLSNQAEMTDALKESLASKDHDLEQGKERIAALEAKLNDQTAMTDALKESLASKDHDLEQAKERTAALEAKLSDQIDIAEALKASLSSKNNEIEEAMERVASLEADLSSAVEQAEAQEAGVTSLQSDLASSLNARSSLESDLSESHQIIDDLKAKLDQQTQWHHDNKKWAESLKQKLENVEVENEELKTAVGNFKITKTDLESQVSQSSKDADRLKLQVSNLLSELKTASSDLDSRDKLIAELEVAEQQKGEEHKEAIEALQARILTLEQSAQAVTSAQRIAQEAILKSQLEAEDLRGKYASQLKRSEELTHLLINLKSGLASLDLLPSTETAVDEN